MFANFFSAPPPNSITFDICNCICIIVVICIKMNVLPEHNHRPHTQWRPCFRKLHFSSSPICSPHFPPLEKRTITHWLSNASLFIFKDPPTFRWVLGSLTATSSVFIRHYCPRSLPRSSLGMLTHPCLCQLFLTTFML